MVTLSGVQLRDILSREPRKPAPGRVDVWLLSTLMTQVDRDFYGGVLNPYERERGSRFYRSADHDRFMVGRGGLRRILSLYCGIAPEELAFVTGRHGKPALPACPAVAFNMSHSGDCVLIAVTSGAECGVDIERKRSGFEEESIAERFFSPREVAWLARTDAGFLRLWAVKESIIKAVGSGLSIPLSEVDVTDVVEAKASMLTLRTSDLPARVLWAYELETPEDYVAALAVIGERCSIAFLPE